MRGFIRKRTAKDGTTRYDCRFRAGGRLVSKTFTTKKAADTYLSETVANVAAGTYRRVTPLLMRDVLTLWTQSLAANETMGQLKRSTRRAYCSIVKHHLIPTFGDWPSDQLSTATVSQWKAATAERIVNGELSPKTFNNAVGALSASG